MLDRRDARFLHASEHHFRRPLTGCSQPAQCRGSRYSIVASVRRRLGVGRRRGGCPRPMPDGGRSIWGSRFHDISWRLFMRLSRHMTARWDSRDAGCVVANLSGRSRNIARRAADRRPTECARRGRGMQASLGNRARSSGARNASKSGDQRRAYHCAYQLGSSRRSSSTLQTSVSRALTRRKAPRRSRPRSIATWRGLPCTSQAPTEAPPSPFTSTVPPALW